MLPQVIPLRGGLRFVAVLVMCGALLVHISAMHETQEGPSREGDSKAERVRSADGAIRGEEESLLNRVRKSVKNTSTPSLPKIAQRLKAVEDR